MKWPWIGVRFRKAIESLTKKDLWQYWVVRLIKTGSLFYILPVTFDVKTNLAKLGSPLHVRIWKLIFLCYSLDVLYLATASRQVTLNNTSEIEFVNFYAHFISRAIAGSLTFLMARRMRDLTQLFNILSLLKQKFKSILKIDIFLTCKQKSF